jgi:hypothetical protein
VATKRFSISTSPEIHALIKQHADTAGLDVSTYVVAAALERIAEDGRVRDAFAEIDAEIAEAEAAPATSGAAAPVPSDMQLTAEEERELRALRALILDGTDRRTSGSNGAAA